jgi:hypothetical protein
MLLNSAVRASQLIIALLSFSSDIILLLVAKSETIIIAYAALYGLSFNFSPLNNLLAN